ncbi:hypothetical protein EV175_002067 [Coemansia sp. RSA 1933]|nr:hypothetical protein EV175_002067 [Coemansia sp. RSA 1933]
MDESFNTYINQFLIDPSSTETNASSGSSGYGADMDVDKANTLGNELLLQLLLNNVNSTDAATVDPSTLTSFQIDSPADAGVADTNTLLTEAFLSALGPLPYPVGSSAVPENLVAPAAIDIREEDEHMLVDTEEKPPVALKKKAAAPPSVVARPAVQSRAKMQSPKPSSMGANPQKKTIQQQALSAAAATSKRISSTATAPKHVNVPGSQPVAHGSSSSSATVTAAKPSIDENMDEESAAIYAMAEGSDELDGVDLKSMSSKERRQLRNKISARNFRVRRKEYLSNLEAEVRMHKEEADGLRRDLITTKKENQQLRDELQKLRQRFNAVTVSQPAATALSSATMVRAAAAASGPPQRPHQQAKPVAKTVSASPAATPAAASTSAAVTPAAPAAPMVRFNPHKDIGQAAAKKSAAAGSAATNGGWAAKNSGSGYITVNTTMLPVSFGTTFDEIAMEARRKQAVDALLDMGDTVVEKEPCQLDPMLASAMMEAAAIISELLLPQIALELSLAPPQTSSAAATTATPCSAVQC